MLLARTPERSMPNRNQIVRSGGSQSKYLKRANQKVISAASQKTHKKTSSHLHTYTNCTKMIYACENKDGTDCQVLSIKCCWISLFFQINIKSLFNQNNDFCVLFITQQTRSRLQSADKSQAERCQSFQHNQPQSATQRLDCSSLENAAVSRFFCALAVAFMQSVSGKLRRRR